MLDDPVSCALFIDGAGLLAAAALNAPLAATDGGGLGVTPDRPSWGYNARGEKWLVVFAQVIPSSLSFRSRSGASSGEMAFWAQNSSMRPW